MTEHISPDQLRKHARLLRAQRTILQSEIDALRATLRVRTDLLRQYDAQIEVALVLPPGMTIGTRVQVPQPQPPDDTVPAELVGATGTISAFFSSSIPGEPCVYVAWDAGAPDTHSLVEMRHLRVLGKTDGWYSRV